MKKRFLSMFLVVLLLCAVFAACNKESNDAESVLSKTETSLNDASINDDSSAPLDETSETSSATSETSDGSEIESAVETSPSNESETVPVFETSKEQPKPEVIEDPEYADLLKSHKTPEVIEIWMPKGNGYDRWPVKVYFYDKTNKPHAPKLTGKNLKVWAVDKNGKKVDYMYTNKNGVALFVLHPGEYSFIFEGDSYYCESQSDRSIKIKNEKYQPPLEILFTRWPHEVSIDTYPKSLKNVEIYVTDKETGKPLENVYFTNKVYNNDEVKFEGRTDKNGRATIKTLFHYQSGYGKCGFQILFDKEGYDVYIDHNTYTDTTEIHIELQKTKYYDITINIMDYWTKAPIKGVSIPRQFYGNKTTFEKSESGDDGIIKLRLASEDLSEYDIDRIYMSYVYDPKDNPELDPYLSETSLILEIERVEKAEYTLYAFILDRRVYFSTPELLAGPDSYLIEMTRPDTSE